MYRSPERAPHRSRRILAVALLAALAMVASACGGSSGGASSGGKTTVKVGVIPILDVAPIYLGVKQGFFADEDLTLKLETAQGGAAIVPGVMSNQYQFGFSNTTSLLLANSQGLDVRAVTSGVASTGKVGGDFGGVIVKKDSPIKSAADLAGKKVAVNTLKNINTTTVNEVVRKAGGDISKISYVELAFPDMLAAIQKGDVDAAQVVEPFLTMGKQAGDRVVASNYAGTDPNLTVAMYFTSANYAKQHPDLVKKFKTAMNKSLEYADSHPDDVRQILSSYTDIDPKVQSAVTLPKWPMEIDKGAVQKLADLAAQDKLTTKKPDLDELLP